MEAAAAAPFGTHLISVRYVHGHAALRHEARDAGSPSHSNLLALIHFRHCASGAHVEQLRDETPATEKIENNQKLFFCFEAIFVEGKTQGKFGVNKSLIANQSQIGYKVQSSIEIFSNILSSKL